jgi:hypothetical protein
MQHRFRDAAEHPALHPAVTVRGHHNQMATFDFSHWCPPSYAG